VAEAKVGVTSGTTRLKTEGSEVAMAQEASVLDF
jgi:hypothetical protein